MAGPPEGFYEDPEDSSMQRWWDGEQWTDVRRPVSDTGPPTPATPPAPDDTPHSPAPPTDDDEQTNDSTLGESVGAIAGIALLLFFAFQIFGGGQLFGNSGSGANPVESLEEERARLAEYVDVQLKECFVNTAGSLAVATATVRNDHPSDPLQVDFYVFWYDAAGRQLDDSIGATTVGAGQSVVAETGTFAPDEAADCEIYDVKVRKKM